MYLKAHSKPERNLVQVSARLTKIFVLHPIRVKKHKTWWSYPRILKRRYLWKLRLSLIVNTLTSKDIYFMKELYNIFITAYLQYFYFFCFVDLKTYFDSSQKSQLEYSTRRNFSRWWLLLSKVYSTQHHNIKIKLKILDFKALHKKPLIDQKVCYWLWSMLYSK